MHEEASFFLSKDASRRPYIHALDKLYSNYDCTPFSEKLYEIETKLFNDSYADQNSFKQDLLKINALTKDVIDTLIGNSFNILRNPTVEESCQLPIYSSVQFRENSTLYTMRISSCRQLHYSLIESAKLNEPLVPVSRLYIRKRSSLLLEAKDNINGILALFFDTQIEPVEGSDDLYELKSHVLTVHPLGDIQPCTIPDLQGWIKAKVIKSKHVDTVISSRIVNKLFRGDSEVVCKLSTKPNTKLKYARENEIRQCFLRKIISSSYSKVNSYYNIPHDKSFTTNNILIKDYTPEQYSVDLFSRPELPKPSLSNCRQTSHWKKIEEYSKEKGCLVLLKKEYGDLSQRSADAHGYFKEVYFTENDVVQLFQKSTSSQRVTEIACLLKLREQEHIGRINQVIFDDFGVEAIGLTMERYYMTLKEYLKVYNHRHFTNYQRMDIVLQMLKALKTVHKNGIAHRDLSTVNFMVNIDKNQVPLDDGSTKIRLYLIDFGKSIFFHPEEARHWWVNTNEQHIYPDEMKPRSEEELTIWCKNLPYIMARPDHGYKFYRSIQTLPKSSKDHDPLPHLINAFAEDIYSLGTLIWKIFSGIEPWPGTFDTDFKKLRQIVSSDYMIDHVLAREVSGEMSKVLLKKFLRVNPEDRQPIAEILDWILQPHILETLLNEWDISDSSSSFKYKHAVTDEKNASTNLKGRPKGMQNKRTAMKIKMQTIGKGRVIDTNKKDSETVIRRPRGRPKGSFKKRDPIEENKPKRPVGRPRKQPKLDPVE